MAAVVLEASPSKTAAALDSPSVPPSSSAYHLSAVDMTTGSGAAGTESTVIWLFSAGPCNNGTFYLRRVTMTQSSISMVAIPWRTPPFTVASFNDPNDVVKVNHASFKAHFEGSLTSRMGAFVTLNPPRNSDLSYGGTTLAQLLAAHVASPAPVHYTAILAFINSHRYAKRYPVHKGPCEEVMPASLTWQTEQNSYKCVGGECDQGTALVSGLPVYWSDRAIMFTSNFTGTSAVTFAASCAFAMSMEVYLNDQPGLMSGVTHAASQAATNVAHALTQGIFGASHDPMQPQGAGIANAMSNAQHKAGRSIMRFLRSKKAVKAEEEGAMGMASLLL